MRTDSQRYRRIYPDLPGMGESPAGSIDSGLHKTRAKTRRSSLHKCTTSR